MALFFPLSLYSQAVFPTHSENKSQNNIFPRPETSAHLKIASSLIQGKHVSAAMKLKSIFVLKS